jgi:hypothetical protein
MRLASRGYHAMRLQLLDEPNPPLERPVAESAWQQAVDDRASLALDG